MVKSASEIGARRKEFAVLSRLEALEVVFIGRRQIFSRERLARVYRTKGAQVSMISSRALTISLRLMCNFALYIRPRGVISATCRSEIDSFLCL